MTNRCPAFVCAGDIAMAAIDDGCWALIAEIVVDMYLAARAAHAVVIKPATREVYERGQLRADL